MQQDLQGLDGGKLNGRVAIGELLIYAVAQAMV
jgi:hypothetical protein